MTVKGLSKVPIIHVGSVKNLRRKRKATAARPGLMWFEFTDAYSVFDYGKMPDGIPDKGAAAAMMTAHLFEKLGQPGTWRAFRRGPALDAIRDRALREELRGSQVLKKLCAGGLPTHYQGVVNEAGRVVSLSDLTAPSRVLQVASVRILRPTATLVGKRRLYNYASFTPQSTNLLLPLECIFRFGVPKGSSLLGRLAENPDYGLELGIPATLREGARLPRPVLEFFSKLEPADRFFNYEFAMNAGGLSVKDFHTLCHTTLLTALWLREEFAGIGIKLWDGKFEFLRLAGAIALGDAITPDELRLTYKNLQISKEPLRQYHHIHQRRFVRSMQKAGKIAMSEDKSLAQIVEDLGAPPRPLPLEMIEVISDMYAGITERLLGRDVFGGRPRLSAVVKRLKNLGVA